MDTLIDSCSIPAPRSWRLCDRKNTETGLKRISARALIAVRAPSRQQDGRIRCCAYSEHARGADGRRTWCAACAPETVNGRSLRPTSLRGAFCCYDLLGRLAGEFCHVVKLECEAADASRSGAHLDDEIADLALRHHGADHVPAFPALAGIETENLTTPARQDGVDLGGSIRWARDFHHVDGLQQHRLALRQRIDDAFLDRRDVIARHHAAGDLVFEDEPGIAR